MGANLIQFISLPFVQSLITIVHIFTCVMLILVVLIQSGKGAEISASFSGSSQTVFGSSGGANFFTHFTRGAAGLFMVTSILLTVGGSQSNKEGVMERMSKSSAPAQTAPATPAQDASKPAAPATGANAPATNAATPEAPKK